MFSAPFFPRRDGDGALKCAATKGGEILPLAFGMQRIVCNTDGEASLALSQAGASSRTPRKFGRFDRDALAIVLWTGIDGALKCAVAKGG